VAKKQSKFLKHQKIFAGAIAVVFLGVIGYASTLVIKESPLGEFVEGEHYSIIDQPHRIRGDKVEVMEFFSYACSACYRFEPLIKNWVSNNRDYVKFSRSPLPANETWRRVTQHYYAMEKLGVLEEKHDKFFHAIHDRKLNIGSPARLTEWANDNDMTGYEEAFNSSDVKRKVALADQLARRVQVASVPALLVQGKYVIRLKNSIGQARMLKILDHLIELEKKPTNVNQS